MTRALIPALGLCFATALPAAAPPPAILDAKGQAALSGFLAESVGRGDVPGVVVLVVAPDRVLYHEAFGKMDVAQGVDMRKDAIFRIASMTKPLTSVAAMILGDVIETLSGQRIDAFLESRIFRPLGMQDTAWTVPPAKHARVVTLHQKTDGRLKEIPNPATVAAQPRGDGRLLSTAADYARFVQMILNHGQLGTVRLLKAETVREMGRNHTGDVRVRQQPVANSEYSKPYPLGAGEDAWGLGFQLAAPVRPDPGMRRPGSMSWAGINNTFFWIDPQAEIGVIVLMQVLPFYDEAALGVLRGVEARVYQHLQRQAP